MRNGTNEGTPDILSIVEAAYTVDGSVQAWTRRLLDAADQSIGRGLGGFACVFKAHPNGTIDIDRRSAAVVRQPLETVHAIFDGLTRARTGWLSADLEDGGSVARCLMTSEVDPQRKLSYRDQLARSGIHDAVNVACMDRDRRGLLLSVGVPAEATITPATRTSLVRVATHILTALRLRARLADERRALQAAVRDVVRSRIESRTDPPPAVGLPRDLASARWSLVHRFESNGARYVVARENAPRARGLSALTPTERGVVRHAARGSSTKEIAHTLGISDTTVRVLLMRAARRCGVSSREALLALGRGAFAEITDAGDLRHEGRRTP